MNDALLQYMNADDEPTAQEAGAALAKALRRKQDLGILASISGGKLAAPGAALMSAAGHDQQQFMHAGVARTARLDRRSDKEATALERLKSFTAQQAEQKIDNERAERALTVSDKNADASRGIAAGMAALAQSNSVDSRKNRAATDQSDLRKEFNSLPDVKTFNDVDSAFQKVKSAASNPSAAGDLSAIFAYMKMLDPGSSVHEGEFANAQNAGGIDQKIAAAYNNVLNGQRLTQGQREDFIKQAAGLHQVHRQKYDTAAARYSDLAKMQGSAPAAVVPTAPAVAAPARPIAVGPNGQKLTLAQDGKSWVPTP